MVCIPPRSQNRSYASNGWVRLHTTELELKPSLVLWLLFNPYPGASPCKDAVTYCSSEDTALPPCSLSFPTKTCFAGFQAAPPTPTQKTAAFGSVFTSCHCFKVAQSHYGEKNGKLMQHALRKVVIKVDKLNFLANLPLWKVTWYHKLSVKKKF